MVGPAHGAIIQRGSFAPTVGDAGPVKRHAAAAACPSRRGSIGSMKIEPGLRLCRGREPAEPRAGYPMVATSSSTNIRVTGLHAQCLLEPVPCELTFFGENGKVRYSLDSRKFTRKFEILIYS